MSRKVFESQTVNMETGEVKSITKVTVTKSKETFSMCRTTNGVEWIKEFSGREMQLFIVLNNIENLETHMVNLTPLSRQDICSFFEITKSTLANLLATMEDKAFLVRLSKSDILLNPSYFYKGESSMVVKRIKEFKETYDKIRRAENVNH